MPPARVQPKAPSAATSPRVAPHSATSPTGAQRFASKLCSPHARTVASNDSGRIPCLLPPNASKLASIRRLSSPMSSTTLGALYALLDWSAASFLAHAANGAGETKDDDAGREAESPPAAPAKAAMVAFASGVPSDAATAAVTALSLIHI